MEALKRYIYIIGFVLKLKDIHEQLNSKQEKLNNIFKNWIQTEENFDNSLETLKLYYHRRYVEGILDEIN